MDIKDVMNELDIVFGEGWSKNNLALTIEFYRAKKNKDSLFCILFSEFKKMRDELLEMVKKRDFEKYDWYIKVQKLKYNPNSILLEKMGISFGDLEALGYAYVYSEEVGTEIMEFLNNKYEKIFSVWERI